MYRAGGQASARSCSPRPGQAGRRSRQAREVRGALRGGPLQLPAHRGPRVLHRPARRRRVPPVRAGCRRPARRRRVSSTVADDVFFLRRDEVRRGAAQRWRPARRCRRQRRATFEAAGKVVAAGGGRHTARIAGRAAPRSVHGRASSSGCSAWCRPTTTPIRTSSEPSPARPASYTAKARVVRSLAEAQDLEEGEVMVCEMTLPPWVPLFSIAGAVVADVGGVLSHCAIVAREFGVPAVVGAVTRHHCDQDRPDHHGRRHQRPRLPRRPLPRLTPSAHRFLGCLTHLAANCLPGGCRTTSSGARVSRRSGAPSRCGPTARQCAARLLVRVTPSCRIDDRPPASGQLVMLLQLPFVRAEVRCAHCARCSSPRLRCGGPARRGRWTRSRTLPVASRTSC